MPTKHVVTQGECISRIAFEYGFFPETVWEHPDNKDLKELRKNPYVLMPGDVVVIPDKRVKEVAKPTGQRHRFRRKGVPEKLVMKFTRGDELRANAKYLLEIDGRRSEGSTDGGGIVELEIPPNAKIGKITFVEEGDEYELELGHLDPITELSGIQGRLRNLGLYEGPVDGEMNEELEKAIVLFQERNKLEPTGKVDDSLKGTLQNAHGT
jgi:hypothetical protein